MVEAERLKKFFAEYDDDIHDAKYYRYHVAHRISLGEIISMKFALWNQLLAESFQFTTLLITLISLVISYHITSHHNTHHIISFTHRSSDMDRLTRDRAREIERDAEDAALEEKEEKERIEKERVKAQEQEGA